MQKSLKYTIVGCVALVAACKKEATGQVAAVVNGDEITLQELNAELQGVPVQEGADRKPLQQAALQRIIERRLLAQQARKDGLDKTPEFLIRSRQLEDSLLVQLLATNAGRGSEVPSQAAVDSYIRGNAAQFAGRVIYTLDRIQFPTPSSPAVLKPLNDAHSMDAVAAALKAEGVDFKRDQGRMDSAQVPAPMLQRITSLPKGEPFVVPEAGRVTVAVITGASPQPVGADQAKPLAVQAIRSKALTDTLRQRLKTAQSEAKIQYQPGFAPQPAPQANGARRSPA